jgi:HK97 family phage prohead protease
MPAGLELRASENGGPGTLVGMAAVFDKLSEDMGFREIVAPGAFKRSLGDGADVRALREHDPARMLGRTSAGSLSLRETELGLEGTIRLPDTQEGRDTATLVKGGELSGMSIGFRTITDEWATVNEEQVRTLREVDLFDVSVVAFPAYPDTTIAKRSLAAVQAGWKAEADAREWQDREDRDRSELDAAAPVV